MISFWISVVPPKNAARSVIRTRSTGSANFPGHTVTVATADTPHAGYVSAGGSRN